MTTPVEMTAYRIMAETGLSARELAEMDLSEYARITGRPTPAQAARAALQAQQQPPAQDATRTVPAEQPQAPETPDFGAMDMATYAEFREQAGVGRTSKENRGIFSAPGHDALADATRAYAGRTALGNANVVEPPRLTGRQARQGDMRDPRSAAQRFSVPGNSWQPR